MKKKKKNDRLKSEKDGDFRMKELTKKSKIIFKLFIVLNLLFTSRYLIIKTEAATTVANITIYSTINNDHSWLVVKNTDSKPIKVGHYNLGPGLSVTIGTWGNIEQHKGIWYNYEGYLYNKFSTHVSISKNATQLELNDFNTAVNSFDRWNIVNTCAYFAGYVWDHTFSSPKVNVGAYPSLLATSLKGISGYVTNRSIPSKTKDNIYYHSTNGIIKCSNPIGSGSSSSSVSSLENTYATSFTKEEISYLNSNRKEMNK